MEHSPTTLWLIPARAGSKGIPGKNIKSFCGQPLVSRSVFQALECMVHGDTVFVSTDSPEIKKIVENCGIEIPFLRPDDLASDNASSYSVMVHAIKEFARKGKTFDRMVLLQPTSPLRSKDDIIGAVKLWEPGIDMVVSVCLSKSNPYYNLFETDSEGFLKISKGDGTITRRQDAPKVWEYNGAVYVISIPSLLKSPLSGFKRIIPFEMPVERSIDLDTPQDWIIAETLFQSL